MSTAILPPCLCEQCSADPTHPQAPHHQRLRAVLARLDEQQRRWVAALEVTNLGYGGTRLVAQITGLDEKTIRRGRRELSGGLVGVDPGRVRKPGGGRKPVEKSLPVSFDGWLMALVGDEVAGDPITTVRWIRRSLRKLERALARTGQRLSHTTIGRVLRAHRIRAKANVKHLTPRPHPDRDRQFRHLLRTRRRFERASLPVISVDPRFSIILANFS